ncbi:hypothetical protein HPB48_000839 [Haemaphysalis longicornis]|uniref:OTU domain-containing protein n=1 Tax=Haemaphysalis longicornis TaxID=44386 RepID=A0A9J6H2A6_HAELO|nr:hypothetical protein HPB48_000839 [Haemaphysalis longicornis]
MIRRRLEMSQIAGRLFHNFRLSIFTVVVENCLSEKKVPLKNILGLACHNASVMVDERISLAQKLQHKADRSYVLIRCISHSTHIVASKAAMKRPRYLEDLLRNIKTARDKHKYLHYRSSSGLKKRRFCGHARPDGSCFMRALSVY